MGWVIVVLVMVFIFGGLFLSTSANSSKKTEANCIKINEKEATIIKKYQEELDKWFKQNNWEYWSPLSILARLYEECGEFAREVNHLYGDKPKKKDEKNGDIEMEIGDIIYTLICFANKYHINLDRAIRKSFDKVITRDKDRY